MEFALLNKNFADQAAELVTTKYGQVSLEHQAFNPDALKELDLVGDLMDWAANGASVVAHENGRIRGFIVGRFINFYQSSNAFFSPDWGHVTADPKPDRTFDEMYAWLCRSGQVDKSSVHAISVYAADDAMKSVLSHLEFGIHMMEGVLKIPPESVPHKEVNGVHIRAATSDDLREIVELDRQLWTHLSEPPISLGLNLGDYPADNPKYRIPRDDSYISVAEQDGQLIGFISCRLGIQEFIGLRNPKIPAINGAFVDKNHRDGNVGQALLDDIFRMAVEMSAPYVTVDFESTNIEGSGFWRSRDFTPLGYGMTRRIPI